MLGHDYLEAGFGMTPFAVAAFLRDHLESVTPEQRLDLPGRQPAGAGSQPTLTSQAMAPSFSDTGEGSR